ncbi:hypothetical protein CUJ91_31955 (plasmid) [Paraburkholderia graminis]|uniref:GTP-binding protein n=1 Tax=Paraburkholderia graminis TaxID=60548 RepID=UPI000DEEC3B8|nr:GTP-binding protein [Paraburkholderia graminis]AXF12621.1 hypothetical protein CUJ91_31955 [Paraburkholderia graminis]
MFDIAGATAIVLNRMDLLDEPSREATVARVEELASHCVMLQATRGAIRLGVIFDQNVRHARRDSSGAPPTGTPPPLDVTSFSFVTGARLDRTRLKGALRGLSAKLLRAKGFVHVAGGGALHELHVVGSRVVMSARLDRTSAESSIVFIGKFSGEVELRARAALQAAEVDQS